MTSTYCTNKSKGYHSAHVSRRKVKGGHQHMATYIRRHESQGRRIVNRNDAHFRNLGKHCRNKNPSEHRHAPAVLMPVKSLRAGNAHVHESIGANESVASVHRLRLVVEKAEKAGQDQGLADGKSEQSKPWNSDGEESRSQGSDAA